MSFDFDERGELIQSGGGFHFDEAGNMIGSQKPPADKSGDFARGAKASFQQLPQLGYGILAGAGAGLESMVGEGGIATGIKKAGIAGYKDWGDKIAKDSKESDSWDYSYDQAKQGNFGALVDWLQHGIGYVGGQAIQTLATGGIGAVGGKFVAGTAAKQIAEGMVAKEAAAIGASEAAKNLSAQEIAKLATVNVANKFATIGQTAAVGANAVGMEGGEIFGDLTSKNADRSLTGAELGKAFAATLAAGGLEFVGDKVGLDIMLGKSALLKPAAGMTGLTGRAARGAIAAGGAAPIEGGTEYGQTLLEEFGKGNDPFSPESLKQARESAALGILGGTVVGGAGGALRGPQAKKPEITDPIAEIGSSSSVDEAITKAADILAGTNPQPTTLGTQTNVTAGPGFDVGSLTAPTTQGILSAGQQANDQADLDSLIASETRDLQVIDANRAQERQKQAELDQIQSTGTGQYGIAPEARPAVEQAATVEAPTAMQLALEKARLKAMRPTIPEVPAVPSGSPENTGVSPEIVRSSTGNSPVLTPEQQSATPHPNAQPGDITRNNGIPYQTENGARLRLSEVVKKGGSGEVVQIGEGAFVVRPKEANAKTPETVQVQPQQQTTAPDAIANRTDAPAEVQPAAGSVVDEVVNAEQPDRALETQNKVGRKDFAQIAQPENNNLADAKQEPADAKQRTGDQRLIPKSKREDLGHLGRDSVPLTEGGKPFKTNKAAKEAKKNQPTMRVIRVEGGFALAPKTEAQIAAEARSARRLAVPRFGNPGVPLAAHEFVASRGGLRPNERSDMGIQGNVRVGNRFLFAGTTGMDMDSITEALKEAGYLRDGATHDDARNLIKRSLNNPQYTPEGTEKMAEREIEAQRAAFEAEQEAIAAAQEAEDNELDMAVAAFERAMDEIPKGLAQSDMSMEDALLVAGYTQQEIDDERSQNERAEADQSPAEAAPGESAQSDRGREGAQSQDSPAGSEEGVAKPLYASRSVTNADDIIAWATSQGFKTTLPADDMHVTVAYSSQPVDGSKAGTTTPAVSITGGKRSVEPLGDEGAIVLKFTSDELQARWKQYRDAGASWDYEGYTPHVTLTYDGKGVDLSKVKPYEGPIQLGAEKQEALNEDKADEYVEEPTLTSPTRADVLKQQADAEAEAKRKEDGGDKPLPRKELTGDVPDMFNPQGSVFDQPAEAPAEKLEAGQSEIDEARALQYKTPDLARLLADGLSPTDGFEMHLLANSLKVAREYNRMMTAHKGDFSGIEFSHPEDPKYPNIPTKYAFVLPDASQPGKWRISYFDKNGFSRHESEKTRESAQVSLVTEGYTIEEKGALDRLAATKEWAKGTAYADLIMKLNKGEITHAQFIEAQQKLNADEQDVLTAPTREEILARQEKAEQAERTAKAQKKAQDLLDKREQERKDIAARSEGAADTFVLGGDAEQNLSGQGGIFDQPAEPESDWMTKLFGTPEQQAEAQAKSETDAAVKKASIARIRSAITEQLGRAKSEYDDWAGKVYKANKTQVDLRGDGPSNQDSMSIGAINESRRQNAMAALAQEMAALEKLADSVSTDSGVERVLSNLTNLMEQAERVVASGNGIFKTADEQFEYMFLDDLKFRGPSGKGNITSNGLSKAILAAIKPSGAAQPAPAAQATEILNAANITGKERIDALKDVKSGTITPDELKEAYPAKEEAKPLVAKEPEPTYSGTYETDLFGNPIPTPTGGVAPGRSKSAGVRGNVQPESSVSDTPAPSGDYYVNTLIASETKRELGASLIRTPVHAAQATQYLYKSAVERFDGIVTDKNGKPLAVVGGFKGAISQASVYPGTIMAEAIRIPGAANIWFSHNHPSGKSMLSAADKRLNETMTDVFRGSGIEPMGLLAVAGNDYSYVDANGSISNDPIPTAVARKSVPVMERQLADSSQAREVFSDPASARQAGRALYAKAKEPGIMLMDAQMGLAAWIPITKTMMGPLRGTGGAAAVYRAVSQSNASNAIIIHGGELDYAGIGNYQKFTPSENIAAALRKVDVSPLDSINVVTGKSQAEQGRPIADGPMFSRADNEAPKPQNQPNGTTVANLQAAIKAVTGVDGFNKLGRIVATTAADIKSTWEPLIGYGVNLESQESAGKAQAFYDPKSKTVFLIADNIREGDEAAVLAHELIHKWGKTVLGEEGWNRLHDVINSWKDAPTNSDERTVYDYARRHVEAVGMELSSEEMFPYAVEAAIKMGIKPSMAAKKGTVARWLESVKQNLAQVWAKVTGKPETFKAQDLVNLAFGIAQMENPEHSSVKHALNGPAAQTDTPAFKAWFGDSKVVDADGEPLASRSGLVLARKSAMSESRPDSDTGNAKPLADLLVSKTFSLQGLGGLEVPSQREVLNGVIALGDDLKVLRSVVELIPVDVVNILSRKNVAPEMLFSDKAMLKELLSIDSDGSVSTAVKVADALVVAVARMATKGTLIDASMAASNGEKNSASNAGVSDGFHSRIVDEIKPIGNNGNFDPTNPDIRFSRSTIVGQTNRQHTPEQLKAMKNVGFQVEVPTLKERAQALWQDAGKKMAQGIVDQFAPVKDLDKEAYGLLRLAKGASGAFESFLQGGKLKLTDGVYDFDEQNKGGVVDKLLIPLQGEHHDFMRWVAANRAERLTAEGKENLFTPEDIKALKTLADGKTDFDYTIQTGPNAGKVTRDRTQIYADSLRVFNGFNKNILDMAEQSGLIDGESRKVWEHEFYVPFYRVADDADGGVRGMNIKGSVVRQQAFKLLKGGKQALNADLLDNTLMNWAHLLDASAKNRAAKATIEAAEKMGIATGGNQSTLAQMGSSIGNKNGVVWFMDQGQKRYSLVDDHYLLTALGALEYAGMRNPVMNAMSSFKHALTVGVTASPFFKIRNLIRDSVQVIGTSKIGVNPAANIAQGWKLTDPKSDAYFRLLAGGGTIHFGTMMEGSEAKRVQALVESGVDEANILDSQSKVKTFYRKFIEPGITAYNELGNRGEAINRATLYDQLIKQGMSHADASLQARDLMDFSMQGSFTTIRFLTQVVPFLNARLQGLYKLGRAAKEDPARFSAVVGATALMSLSLLAAFGDDDDWKKREEWDRNNYWWFKFGGTAFRIPKPFEIGAIATLAERGFELAFDKEMTSKRFRQQVLTLLGDNLSMNPVPQLIKPVIDVYANKDSFSGRPIESMGMERLKSEYRFNDRTSMTARALSTAANSVTGLVGAEAASPVQIDHMLRGYFGWLGSFVVGAGDIVARPATGQVGHATPDMWKVATGGMVSDLRDAPSRYVSQMYAQAREIEQAYGTYRELLKQGKTQEAQEFAADNREDLMKYHRIETVKKQESKLNERIRLIERSNMDGDTKRSIIRTIQVQKNRIAENLIAQ